MLVHPPERGKVHFLAPDHAFPGFRWTCGIPPPHGRPPYEAGEHDYDSTERLKRQPRRLDIWNYEHISLTERPLEFSSREEWKWSSRGKPRDWIRLDDPVAESS